MSEKNTGGPVAINAAEWGLGRHGTDIVDGGGFNIISIEDASAILDGWDVKLDINHWADAPGRAYREVSEEEAECLAAFVLRACKAHDDLVRAAQAVLAHRKGDFPTAGWLKDNDASRSALADLATALKKAGAA